MKRRTGLLIFMFWVVVPTLDQYSDLAILTSLYTGPDPGMEVRGGRARPCISFIIVSWPCSLFRDSLS